MKILVACELPEAALLELRSLSSEVRHEPDMRPEQLREAITDMSILVVDSRRVSPEVIARGGALQMIVHAGPGAGDIAINEASAAGIFVTHCPNQHASAVAELTFGLILALDRRIVDNTLALRAGRWDHGEFKQARGLAGQTLGILGYGPVGREVAQRARAFAMNIAAWHPTWTPEMPADRGVNFCNRPRELARQSDIVTVHATQEDGKPQVLVDAEFLESMRPGAHLVHMGHSGALDEAAVIEAIRTRHLRVALDVFGSEPASDSVRFRCRICEQPGVIGTHHIGPVTAQAHRATAAEVVRIIRGFLISGEINNCINLVERSPATWQLVLRVRDAVGVMASILEAIRADGINAEEITSRVFLGAQAAWCAIALNERPSTETLEAIRALDAVLYLEIRAVV